MVSLLVDVWRGVWCGLVVKPQAPAWGSGGAVERGLGSGLGVGMKRSREPFWRCE